MSEEQISIGNGGWVRFTRGDDSVFVRFDDRGGRLTAVDLLFSSDRGIDAKTIRRFPVARLEATANKHLAEHIRERMRWPGPLVREAAALYATSFGSQAPDHWAKQMLQGQLPGSPYPKVMGVKPKPTAAGPAPPADLIVKVPVSRAYGDDFYQSVADAYLAAASGSNRPAKEIAEVNDVPVATVHRWVKEARRRKMLPTARPGKAG